MGINGGVVMTALSYVAKTTLVQPITVALYNQASFAVRNLTAKGRKMELVLQENEALAHELERAKVVIYKNSLKNSQEGGETCLNT